MGYRVALALIVLLLPLAASTFAQESNDAQRRAVNAVLDDWHQAAAEANESRYFSHLTDDAVFFGTDATERWTKPQFRTWAKPHFDKGKAWSFKSSHRSLSFNKDGTTAWFDETLDTPNLGPVRGTGVLVLDNGTWKIAQYHLCVPIPNTIFDNVKKLIEAELSAKPAPAPAPDPSKPGKHDAPPDDDEDKEAGDASVEKRLAEGKADAREWLSPKHERHIVWKWSRDAALKAIEELHAAGAISVWVVDIIKEQNAELASSFVVELPKDKAARGKVFAWIAKWEKHVEMDDDELTKDTGQKYWVLETDL